MALAAMVEALPVLIFAAVATFVMPLTEPQTADARRRRRADRRDALGARLVWRSPASRCLSPAAQALYALSEETRNYLYIWMRRFAFWAAYGYAAVGSALGGSARPARSTGS